VGSQAPQVARRAGFALFALVAAMAVAATAGAAGAPGVEQVHLTAGDQAKAKTAVVTRADLGPGWTGGARKPSGPSTPSCGSWHPKQSDLVLTGQAESAFKQPGFEIDSEAQVLQTAKMVALDWQRTVVAPQILTCLRQKIAQAAAPGEKLVSVGRVAFPHVARYSGAVRVVIDVTVSGSTLRMRYDVILVGSGRTEITLAFTSPEAAAATIGPAEVRLARLLAARAAT
jgi:hypothetical protein